MEGLTVSATLGLLDAKYKNFTDPVTGADLTKYDLRRAPKFNTNLEPVYQWNMLDGRWTARASWHYVDKMAMTFFNSKQTENAAQNIVDASLGYEWKKTMITPMMKPIMAPAATFNVVCGRNLLGVGSCTMSASTRSTPGKT